RPTGGMTGRAEHERERGRHDRFQWQKRVCRDSGKERACAFFFEQEFRQQCCRAHGSDSKFSERDWMSRPVQYRLQKLSRQFFPIARQRLHQIAIGAAVAAELLARKIDILMKTGGASVIEWMRERDLR